MTDLLSLLRAPSANRVYAAQAGPLALAEARWVLGAHHGPSLAVRPEEVAGIEHLRISSRDPEERIGPQSTLPALAAQLSSAFAAFAPVDLEGEELLRPARLPDVHHHASALETTLRYPGKTNEQFTALLLNLAAALSDRRAGILDGSLAVLDPICGRGTTLSRALRLGLSPVGADIDSADVDAYRAFLLTWAKQGRLKHSSRASRLTVSRRQLGTRFELELAKDKAAQRAGRAQRLTLLGCDTTELGSVLPSGSVDAIVADLPYGVQHGARSEARWSRSPLDLLGAAAPVWRSLLRAGGGMALAVNRHTAPFASARAVLAEHGFTVLSRDGEFRHRVDQSIDRDVILAVRSDHPRMAALQELADSISSSPLEPAASRPGDPSPTTTAASAPSAPLAAAPDERTPDV
ncbi:hypothetical protein Bequi_01610 [Brachybacterium sp. JHP9]|uniref:Ribosomal RNA large subunit methyltransferase K/L-like methyltransferase domain-containing protein n=1 Tax=Brachybacterium equifaecis TaxID=2910770 RepID=A0ABT0QWQ5_9MICO|nr:hypothetical protein [Brachybacterium equifaecis]MCL6422097.1 hypothetical protein [Brachybacterium equifaecis]